MRPRGEIRSALSMAALELHVERGGGTWRDMAARACVGFDAARRTVENMARSGELIPASTRRVEGIRRPMVVYAPVISCEPRSDGAELERVMSTWATFV